MNPDKKTTSNKPKTRNGGILSAVDKLLFPPLCLACGCRIDSASQVLCEQCQERLVPILENYCLKCGSPLENYNCEACSHLDFVFDFARAAFVYQSPTRELVHSLKYDSLTSPAAFFSRALMEIPAANRFGARFDCVCAIPLHRVRKRERGFNQAELLARKLASMLGLPYVQPIYRRVYTRSQTNLSRQARLENLAGAFALRRKSDIAGKRVILVDDVFTTGSTVNEASKLLKDAGAARVAVLTATRAV